MLIAAGVFVFSLVLLRCSLHATPGRRGRGPIRTFRLRTFLGAARHSRPVSVYSDGLAAVTAAAFEFMAWNEVDEVASVWIKMDRQMVLKRGRPPTHCLH